MTVTHTKIKSSAKRVPAIDKCFKILEFLSTVKRPLGITELSQALGYNKSTVFNIIYTLVELGFLEKIPDNKVRLSNKLFALGRKAGVESYLISMIRSYLEEINQKTNLYVFLGLLSNRKGVIIDKVDSTSPIRVSSEMGMKIPLTIGAGGQALLAQLPETQINKILQEVKGKKNGSSPKAEASQIKNKIMAIRLEGFSLDDEEYIQGIRTLAIPLKLGRPDLQAAIWMVGLKSQVADEKILEYKDLLKNIGTQIETRFSM